MAKRKTLRACKFFFHVNKHILRAGRPDVWTLHYRGACIPATDIKCYVNTETTYKPDGAQPKCKVAGEGVVIDCGKKQYVIVSPQSAFALMLTARDEGKTVKVL